ncbi:MAG: type III-B CRISPR-associated protein Cas10/Cmr2 [Candidatus Brocadia sp. WS118]|nr:MAG: type III-B CRISPR-associated protein Cas10/Cmr2 [Candidatus Brocadia sp. WS118]
MSEYLFLFTVGPVQGFISQARKTQDLYAGSFLLSHLCRTAGRKAETLAKTKTIFPRLDNPSIPNRFIIKFETEDDLQKIGQEIEDTVYKEVIRIAKSILLKMNLDKPYNFDDQLRNYFTANWLFVPVGEKGYADAYREIERVLGAMKNVRRFEQFPEQGRKCSLDGQNNALFYKKRKADPPKDIPNYINIQGQPTEISGDYSIQSGEGLSAVSFMKRFAVKVKNEIDSPEKIESNFPSTARVALLHILNKFEKTKDLNGKISFMDYKSKFPDRFDEQLYFEENLTPQYFQKHEYDCLKNAIPVLKGKLKMIRDLVEDKGYNFTKYYALLMFDGDSMGEWVSGARNKPGFDNRLNDFHTKLTELMGKYAHDSHNYLQEPRGRTVYAGGDDFLGFVNLAHLFSTMVHLRDDFDKIDLSDYSGEKMTFSAGVVIAHYKTPLSEVLKWARRMEKEAKQIDGKNAFAIAVLKHSGEIEQTVGVWRKDDQWIPELLEGIAKRISTDQFSNTFIQNLTRELLGLKDENHEIKIADDKLIECEIKRLVGRSWIGKSKEEENKKNKELEDHRKEQIEKMTGEVVLLFKLSQKNWKHRPVKNFLSALHVADFISREVRYDH